MEIITRVRDFPEKIKYHRVPQDAYVRVIVHTSEKMTGNERMLLPIITHEEQKRILNLIVQEYEPGASEELTKIIGESHLNTDSPEL